MDDAESGEVGVGLAYTDDEVQIVLLISGILAHMDPTGAFFLAQRLASMAQEALQIQGELDRASEEGKEVILKNWMRRIASAGN